MHDFTYLTIRTDKPRHILDNAQHPYTRLPTKINLLAHVLQGDLLWRGNEDCAVDLTLFHVLGDGDVFVGCAAVNGVIW